MGSKQKSLNSIFISYSHKDEDWKDQLITQLRVLEPEGYYLLWDDRKIKAGDDWFQEIETALNRSNVAILMISADFLTSNFIREEEIPRILEYHEKKGVHIIPIIIKPCRWQDVDWLSKLQVRPKDGLPLSAGNEYQINADLSNIVKEIKELLDENEGIPGDQSEFVPPSSGNVFLAKLPTTRRDLFGREKELDILNKAWFNPHCYIVTFVAWGGVGKTALVNEWLNRIVQDNYLGAKRVYGWSFYSQGTSEDRQVSGDEFLFNALQWFGDSDPSEGSPWHKGIRLAELIRKQKTLLILDGLEPLQYPPGDLQGKLKDQGLQVLLKELARLNRGLCVITTRTPVKDIEHAVGNSVTHIDLEHLPPEAGIQILRNLGVQGDTLELREAVLEFRGHALALNLLGSYLFTVHEGDVRKRDLIPAITEDEEQGGHARRVMKSYEKWLQGCPELDILHIMGLFDRPAQGDAIKELRAEPLIEGSTEQLQSISPAKWMYTIKHLRDLHLLAGYDKNQPATLDCHPLIREHFGKKLKNENPKAWREAHTRLYNYYKKLPKKHQPDTMEEMAPLLAAVGHGCQAGLYKETLEDLFLTRIGRHKSSYLTDKLGAINSELALLSQFFTHPWEEIVNEITVEQQAFLLSQTGLRLGLLGRHKEAEKPLQKGLDCYVSTKNWSKAANAARHFSRYYLTQGDLGIAEKLARQGVEYAKKTKKTSDMLETHSTLGEVLHYTGRLKESKKVFEIAMENQKRSKPEYPYLCRLHGFRHFELLLSLGDYEKVIECATETIDWPQQKGFLVGRALHRVTLGRAYLYQTLQQNLDNFTRASKVLEKALEELRKANQIRHTPSGLLALASFNRLQKNFSIAWKNLEEAKEIAIRANSAIHVTDYHIEAGWLCLLQGKNDQANTHLTEVVNKIETTGYKRREPEYYLQSAHLYLAKGDVRNAKKCFSKSKDLITQRGYNCLNMEMRDFENLLQKFLKSQKLLF
jgi:tetratricopeptide (TPR) repeat protein